MTNICKNCLVELEAGMKHCPLCGRAVNENETPARPASAAADARSVTRDGERYLLQRILWQLTTTLLLSGIVATIITDVTKHDRITWSLYPVAICLILLSYSSFFAFWRSQMVYRIVAGWLLSTFLLLAISRLSEAAGWAVELGLPLLWALNFVGLALLTVFRVTKRKGLNLLAYSFVAIAVLCISVEAIISTYVTGEIDLGWSIIVAACLFPVSAALIFMFFRTWNDPRLQKIFHT